MMELLKSCAEYLGNLINHQIGGDSASDAASKSMDEYTMDTFTAYCAFRDTVTVKMWHLDKFLPVSLRKLIVPEIQKNASVSDLSENATLNMPNLKVFQIFENLKTFKIHSTSRRGTVFYPVDVGNLISELSDQAAVISARFSTLIIRARIWTKSGDDQQSDDYSSDDDEFDNGTEHKQSTMDAEQSGFGGTGFRSWIDELWQKSGDSLKEMVNQRLSGWSISYEIGGRIQKNTNLGNEDHLVIQREIEERKEDEEVIMLKGAPKPHPGDYWKDQFPDKIDPRGKPTFIRFKWKTEMKKMTDCDTRHMLYLLQKACHLHRRRVIERNQYFMSISRTDRYINHVDSTQIITNFVKWHDEDKENNVFTGEMLESLDAMAVIDLISNIGGIKQGPATLIYDKLMKEVTMEEDEQRLKIWGKMLEDCTVEDMITLFTFVNEEEKFDGDVDGVFANIEAKADERTAELVAIDGWKETVIQWIREEQVDGNKLKSMKPKDLISTLCVKLEPNDPVKAKTLNESCKRMFQIAKKMNFSVHQVLTTAKAQADPESHSAQ